MKALTLQGAGDVRISEVPEPQPSPGDLLLQVEMVGLCGTDLNSFRGRNPMVSYPRVLGHEIAAVVLNGTDAVPAGTRVTVSPYTACGVCVSCRSGRENACRSNETFGVQRDGAMTERLAVPASKAYPASLSPRELCLVEPLTVGFHAIARGKVTANDNVAVIGCGGVGLGAIAGATFLGARTVAIDVDDVKLATAVKAGASACINSLKQDVRATLSALTGGNGPEVIVEAIGLPDTFRLAVEAVAFTGRVVYIGYAKEPVAYETKLFVEKELDIRGSRNALPEDFFRVIELLETGRFPVEETISAIVAMEDAPAMLKSWSDTPSLYTKILVKIDG